MTSIQKIVIVAISGYLFIGTEVAFCEQALRGNTNWQSGDLGDRAGSAAAAAMNLPGAQERYEARTKNFSQNADQSNQYPNAPADPVGNGQTFDATKNSALDSQ